jgi:FKBP-type peptidyl-prolyl cis-trans isomerase SlyD
MNPMTIENGKVVSLAYLLKDDLGAEIDRATMVDPFLYLHGFNNIVPGLETALAGLKTGDKRTVEVDPLQGYGDLIPELVVQVDRKVFPPQADLQVGASFQADSDDGSHVFRIIKIEDQKITIDGNHPLAGVTLLFSVEVLDVRSATSEELEHGHVHAPGQHSH